MTDKISECVTMNEENMKTMKNLSNDDERVPGCTSDGITSRGKA